MLFVWRRGRTYQVRRRLPRKLIELGSPALLCLSLRTEVLPEAMKRLPRSSPPWGVSSERRVGLATSPMRLQSVPPLASAAHDHPGGRYWLPLSNFLRRRGQRLMASPPDPAIKMTTQGRNILLRHAVTDARIDAPHDIGVEPAEHHGGFLEPGERDMRITLMTA
jgi:hypothetical protein